MAFEKLANSIEELKESIQGYIHSSTEYYKLLIFKNSIKGITALILGVVLFFLLFFFIIFLSIAAAVLISEALDSPSAGFFIVAGFYLLLMILVLVFGKKFLEKTLLTKVSRKMFNK